MPMSKRQPPVGGWAEPRVRRVPMSPVRLAHTRFVPLEAGSFF
jgi:hypothetical protein